VIDAGGSASYATVAYGGSQVVSAGGMADYTTVSYGGTLLISAGGSATFATLSAGGYADVSSGGSADESTVSSGGALFVLSGGAAGYTTVSASGNVLVFSSGATSFTTVSAGGNELVRGGGMAVSTTVLSGGSQYVFSGGLASAATVGSLGVQRVAGLSLDTTVDGGGTVFVYSGGVASSATVADGGAVFVYSGGTAFDTQLDDPGYLIVLPGATASGTLLAGGAVVSTGVVAYQPASGVTAYGPTASHLTISRGGFDDILPGGTAISTTLTETGAETVFTGGVASFTTISSGGVQTILSGGIAVGAIVSSGGTQYVDSSGAASNTTITLGGAEQIGFDATAFSTTILSGGQEYINGGGSALDGTVSAGGYEVISGGGSATGTTVLSGGAIDLAFFAYVSGSTSAFIDSATDLLSVTDGSGFYTQQLAGNYANTVFAASPDAPTGTGTLLELEVLCFVAGTLIATPSGDVPVQHLAVGDMVRTAGGAVRPITWIGEGSVLATRGRRSAATPIIVGKGALGDNVPYRDLRVTKGHSFFLDGALVPVEFLVNHRSIHWDDRAQEVSLYHIELATHDVLLANGAPAESYRDDGNRWLFRNANTGWDHPPKPACAPVLTGGPIVDALWRRLLDRAGPGPLLALTEDADLHLLADGRRIDADRGGPARPGFRLAAAPLTLRIVSRAAAPQELGLARDPRRLGVAIRRIEIRSGSTLRLIEADDARLTDGFHGFEPDNGFRWTDGDALLPAAPFAGLKGPIEVVLHCGGTARYLDGIPLRRTG
jgi:autotransporter passenger strand-loop-strand repeat protein